MRFLFAAVATLGLSACNPDTLQQQVNEAFNEIVDGNYKTYTNDGPPFQPFRY